MEEEKTHEDDRELHINFVLLEAMKRLHISVQKRQGKLLRHKQRHISNAMANSPQGMVHARGGDLVHTL